MRFMCPLIVVNDVEISKKFYQTALNEKIKYDFGENVVFEGGFSIQLKSHYAKMIGISTDSIKEGSNNFELYFEEENFDEFLDRLQLYPEIQFIHGCIEHPWGQRVVRFYDPDRHIVEVGESMEKVVKRLLQQGMTIEEAAKKSQHPVDFVLMCK